ncbi:MAG: xanthine dehydrogenase family protein molybdopterin-binding subunit [Pseudobacteriovorax sp.]|nr:xanthine dehydrogenase family protein molybdopterin-binding subunit [Pseudobacteriovorax sp.]
MIDQIRKISRRDFVKATGITTAGLCLGTLSCQSTPKAAPSGTVAVDPIFKPNVFVHIGEDGIVSIYCHRSEMGQGIRSTLPIILSDELGADFSKVKIIQAIGDKKYGDQNTDGSTSIRKNFDKIRGSAAMARDMLIQTAAQKWNVAKETCDTKDHFVIQKGTNKKIEFAKLVIDASKLALPDQSKVKLRKNSDLDHFHKKMPFVDVKDFVTGNARYGADVDLPNMLIASIERPSVMGATIKSFDNKAPTKVGGVRKIIKMPEPKQPYGFQGWGGVAVLADNTWAAMKGREALAIQWNLGEHASYNTKAFKASMETASKKSGPAYRKKGNPSEALRTAHKKHSAQYYVSHLAHLSMEPPVAIANYTEKDGGFCEVWASTQNPQTARSAVARATGLPEDRVRVNVTLLGGGFGRKSKGDFCSEAAFLSKAAGQPVRVQFTREDDIKNDYLNTVALMTFEAGTDKKGMLKAWQMKSAFPPIASTFMDKSEVPPQARDFQQGILDLAMGIDNFEAQAITVKAHVRIGWLRAVYNLFHSFATNCFLDEIARKEKKDPLDFMLSVYADRVLTPKEMGNTEMHNYEQDIEQHPVNGKRLKQALSRVAAKANWKSRAKDKTRGYGLAVHRSFLSYVAVAAAVKKEQDKIIVDEVWITIDAGIVYNLDRVVSQMEGSVIEGMSHLFHGGITHKNGAVEQSNFNDAGILRMPEAPRKIHVDIVTSTEPSGGVGEPGVPPVAPAIANAIFALTGKRLREFGKA